MTVQLWTLKEIIETPAKTEMIALFTAEDKTDYAALIDIDRRWKKLWRKEGETYTEIDIKALTEEIANYLAKNMRVEHLLQDKLLHEPIENLMSLAQRVKNEGAVKAHRGCFYLVVKGKQGRALEIDL